MVPKRVVLTLILAVLKWIKASTLSVLYIL